MKRRIGTILAMILVLVLTACGAQAPGTENNNTPVQEEQQENQKPEDEKKPEEDETDPEAEEPDGTEEPEDETESKKEIEIYSGNEEATELVTSLVVIPELTAENILKELNFKEVIPENVTANDCKKVEKDGKAALELDLSQSFAEYLNGLGTSGETIALGSVCNTFLKAYECESIKITIDGEMLSTGHAEYPGYMEFFESVR